MDKYTPSSALTPGTLLKGTDCTYAIVRVLGQGSFGITYLARTIVADDEIEQLLCIKEFFMRDVNGRSGTNVTNSSREGLFSYYRHKFEQESEHLRKLRHQGIVMVTDAFNANGTSYYAMQYIDGPSLDSYIAARSRLTATQAVAIARQIGAALQFMHSRGMVHLDVKPANVMMAAGGTAVLVDFGLSKQYDSGGNPESSTTVGAGSPGYAPIEQATHREGQGVPVQMDVYALGATVFKMLTGHRPPEAADILNLGFPRGELVQCHIPKAVADVVQKAMEPQCSKRYKSVGELVNALDHAAQSAANAKASAASASSSAASEATRIESHTPRNKQAASKATEEPSGATSNLSEVANKAGTSIYAVVFTFMAVLALSSIPDLLINGGNGNMYNCLFNLLKEHSDWYPLLLFGVPAAIGALIFTLWEKHKTKLATDGEIFGRAMRWFFITLLFNTAVSWMFKAGINFTIGGGGYFDELSFAVMTHAALAIVTTSLVLRWFKR